MALCLFGLVLGAAGLGVASAYGQRSTTSAAPPRTLSQYAHRAWTTKDGLPHSMVLSITQTQDGYLWIGTRGGLARFDGARFTVFNTRNTEALRSNDIRTLYEDPSGALWIGTLGGGLTRYRDGHFTTFTSEDGLPGDDIAALCGDPREAGTLWIGTTTGLGRYQKGRFETFTTSDGLLSNDIRALATDAQGGLWVQVPGGLHRYEAGRFEAFPVDAPLALDGHGGRLWLARGHGQVRRAPHQLRSLTNGRYQPDDWMPAGDLFTVNALYEDAAGSLWVGTYGGGVIRYHGETQDRFTSSAGLTDDRVQALFEDRAGNLWIGTMNGLNLLHRQAAFTTYATEEGLPDANVRSIVEDESGGLWIATAGGLANLAQGRVTAYTTRDGLPEPFVRALWTDRAGALWLSGQRTLSRLANGGFTRYRLAAQGLPGNIRSIVEDQDGRLWLGSFGGGLVRFAPGNPRVFTRADGLVHDNVTVLLVDRRNRLWIGTMGGLNMLEKGVLRSFTLEDGLANTYVRSLYEDADGTLWIGTVGRGLARYRDGRFLLFTTKEGLYDDGIWSILEDDLGHLWMSSDRGIFRVAKAELEAVAAGRQRQLTSINYGVSDGMITAEANGADKPSGWRTRDGRLWFATQQGVVVVDPTDLPAEVTTPLIEQVASQAQVFRPTEGQAVALAAPQRDFEIHFTAPDFRRAEELRFRYRLAGYEAAWHEGTQRQATYTNIPPGPYTFEVQVARQGGPWAEAPRAAVTLHIAPYFYETWWFFGLCVLGGIALLAGGYRYRIGQVRRRQHALETQVAQRTRELRAEKEKTEAMAERLREMDRAKSRLFANVSHEFRTPLTLTIGPLEDLQHEAADRLTPRDDRRVGLALRNARRLLRLINQLLDVTKIEAGQMRRHPTPGDLVAQVQGLATAFTALAERRQIAYSVETAVPAFPAWYDHDMLEKVVVNLLSNAFKFTPRGGAVSVTLAAEDEVALLTVRDTGIGIAPEQLRHVFDRFYQADDSATRGYEGTGIGLSLVKELVELHGGRVTAESTPGAGSTFTVRWPRGAESSRPGPSGDGLIMQPSTEPNGVVQRGLAAAGEGDAMAADEDGHDATDEEDRTTVLVVDDNTEIRAYVRNHLRSHYRILEAADGQDGLDLVRRHLPDLVISDVMMPRLDGTALCAALKTDPALDCIPVILLTARAEAEDKLAGLGTGADDYVTKPFDVRELALRVDNQITSRRRLRERLAAERAPVYEVGATPLGLASEAEAFLARAREMAETHLGKADFGVDALAEHLGMSRFQFHRRVKELTGQSASEFLRTLRLERAGQLLAAGAGTVSEVAYAVGFNSLSHFSKSFRAHFGTLPSTYRATGESKS